MRKVRQKTGFTLIELLIAVVLMLILVGAVATIFKGVSDAVVAAEATMNITQNARATYEILSRDLAASQVSISPNQMTLDVPGNGTTFLSFPTITSWRLADGTVGEGVTRVSYATTQLANGRWVLDRTLPDVNAGVNYRIGQYLAVDPGDPTTPRLLVEYWNDASNQYTEVTAATNFDNTNLPSSIRITLCFTDRSRRVVRPFSQTLWIATGQN